MSEDLHNNPPFEILQTELGPENNADVKTYKTGGEWQLVFQPVSIDKKCNDKPVFFFNLIMLACYCLAACFKPMASVSLQTKCPWVRHLTIGQCIF